MTQYLLGIDNGCTVSKAGLFTLAGQEVARLIDGVYPAGMHKIRWDAAGRPSGIYLYRLQAGAFTETRKMLLAK